MYYQITKLIPLLVPFLYYPDWSLQTRKPDWRPQLSITKENESITITITPAWPKIMPSWFITIVACKNWGAMHVQTREQILEKYFNQPEAASEPKVYSSLWSFAAQILRHPWWCQHLCRKTMRQHKSPVRSHGQLWILRYCTHEIDFRIWARSTHY